MINAFTVDLEDYFQVSAFSGSVDRPQWASFPSRVEQNTDRVLEILAAAHCRATFFTLGWIAERFPQLIRRVSGAGHELACHSFAHRYVYDLNRQQFREDTLRAKRAIENASGVAVTGYRAPSFSITKSSDWAFEVLADLGFQFDSSVYPVRHPNYGIPEAPLTPYRIETPSGNLIEFPMPALQFGNRRAPFGGGAYLRLLPYAFTRWAINHVNRIENRHVCVYVHPWEFDPVQPRLSTGIAARIRHYVGLRGLTGKVRRLLADFEFEPLGRMANRLLLEKPALTERVAGLQVSDAYARSKPGRAWMT